MTPAVVGYRLDASFGGTGVAALPDFATVRQLVVLDDGSTLAQVEILDPVANTTRRAVVKLRSDGTPDPGFGDAATPGRTDLGSNAGALMVRADGRFFVAARQYLANGRVDASFGVDGYVGNPPATLANIGDVLETGDHRLLATVPGVPFGGCALLPIHENGTYDVNDMLPTGTQCDGPSNALGMSDGSTMLLLDGIEDGVYLLHLRADGSIDPTFGAGTGVASLSAYSQRPEIEPMLDGDMLVVLGDQGSLIKVGPDGQPDAHWASAGKVYFGYGRGPVGAATDAGGATTVLLSDSLSRDPGPYHPAVQRLKVDGQGDLALGLHGRTPGELDLTTIGVPPSTYVSAFAATPNGLLRVGMSIEMPPGRYTALVVALAPDYLTAAPPPPVTPAPATTPTIDGPAVAGQGATRLGGGAA